MALDFEGVNYIDSQGAEKLGDVLKLTRARAAQLRLARVKPAVREVLRRDGFIDRLGESNICGNVFEATKDLTPAVGRQERMTSTIQAGTDDGTPGEGNV